MAKNNRVNLQLRRRRELKTNYKRRLSLLKSRKPRMVIRKTNTQTTVQIVEYYPDGDKIIAQATTKELAKMGYKGSTGNIPAAYLAGFVAATRAIKAKQKHVVVDIGMQKPYHGGRLFAAVKGAVDAGLDVPHNDEALPDDERATGAHIDESLPKMVEQVKKKAGN